MANQTPMMKQYRQIKREHAGALLLFRMGDFYEMFYEDAETAARVLNLALTSRSKGADAVPMAGFPYHALDGYLKKLVEAKVRVAICEQVQDPREAKGLVKREVTRIVTPGTLTDEALLDARAGNYLMALCPDGEQLGAAWVDLSTGEFQAADLASEAAVNEIVRLEPAECLVPEEAWDEKAAWIAELRIEERASVTQRPGWVFDPGEGRESLQRHFGTASLEGFGCESLGPALGAGGALLDYLQETQKTSLQHIRRMSACRVRDRLVMDEVTQRSLEIVRTLRDGRRENTLLWTLDQTQTGMGARLLREWITAPLVDADRINARYDALDELLGDAPGRQDLAKLLGQAYDVQRLAARVGTGRANPRDLVCLARTLEQLPAIKALLAERKSALLAEQHAALDLCEDLHEALTHALVDDPPITVREGGMIRDGVSDELDELRTISKGGQQWIANFQAEESTRTGIPTLKIGFNKVFGYYIEVTHLHREKVPEHYHRKQTLKNAERYTTPELKEYEHKVLGADERARQLEYELFTTLREHLGRHTQRLQAVADVLATCDTLVSLATAAAQRNYCRPTLTEDRTLLVREGRHPVLERLMSEGEFTPNDLEILPEGDRLLIITGPNMAGKSTYIRQVALLAVMAQAGSFVPAEQATIGLVDRVFTRVGASDELARGQSTFMVEMVETANILNNASDRSLIIFDEVGRGTSTFDGLSLAWAITEYIYHHSASRVLFATHYHELTELARVLPGIRNYNVAVREWHDELIFLHKIVEGAADKSYGLHVARLAGIPPEVIERAKVILARLENESLDSQDLPKLARETARKLREAPQQLQMSLFAHAPDPALDEIRRLDLDHLTPAQALAKLQALQSDLRDRQ